MAVQSPVRLTTFEFTVTLVGIDEMTDELQGALLKAGCDDAGLGSRAGVVYLNFDREAGTLGEAIGSAVDDVTRAGFGVAHVEVGPHPG